MPVKEKRPSHLLDIPLERPLVEPLQTNTHVRVNVYYDLGNHIGERGYWLTVSACRIEDNIVSNVIPIGKSDGRYRSHQLENAERYRRRRLEHWRDLIRAQLNRSKTGAYWDIVAGVIAATSQPAGDPYTVFGIYEDADPVDGQWYLGHVLASDAQHAVTIAGEEVANGSHSDLVVLAVVAGHHTDLLQALVGVPACPKSEP